MPASRSARERKAAAQAGPLSIVKIDLSPPGAEFVYRISCRQCSRAKGDQGARAWWTYRPREENGFMAAMDRWIFHLLERHPESDAPCLAFRGEAQERLQARRDGRG